MPPESQTNITPNPLPTTKKTNVAGMVKGMFVGALIGFMAGLITSNISWTAFWVTMIICVVIGALIGSRSDTRAEEKAQFVNNEGLTSTQRTMAWVFSIINPIITGGVMYFMWRHNFPTKAKQANNISIIVFLLWIVVGLFIAFSRS